ncbi:MAG: hypothetical protein K5695_16265 [Oscillospiraceae bacterium]|nr:hypothetical protein [Oscillospiraceae bacterium]
MDDQILDPASGQHWEPEVRKRKPWLAVNIVMAVLLVPACIFIGYVLLTFPPAFFLLLAIIAANGFLGKLSGKARETGKEKPLLHILRTAILCSMVLYFTPLMFVNGFADVPQLYPVKRYIAGSPDTLPASLPAVCEGYHFLTEGVKLTPDSHRSTYLSFYTDTTMLDRYAESFGGHRTETKRAEDMTSEELAACSCYDFPNCPVELPYWVIERVQPEDDLHGAVIYEHSSSSPWFSGAGMLLDYDSGYVVFWT